MLLSFSIPAMLPMVVNGIRKAQAEGRGHLEDGVEEWLAVTFPADLAAVGDRVKAQTIRAITTGRHSAYGRLQAGGRMDLWWKSRTPGRRKLGWVLLPAPPERIAVVHGQEGVVAHRLDRQCGTVGQLDLDPLAFADGFASAEDFRAYFAPRPGDSFDGWVIRWG